MTQARDFADLLNASSKIDVDKFADDAVHGRRNLIINGAMQVAQRGDSTGISNANSGYYGPDRFKFNEDGTMTAVVSIAKETLTSGDAFNAGFLYAYKLSVTTADTAVGADIYTRITQRFEKDTLAPLAKGTSSAKQVTLSFWVKATVTGTNVVEFFDQANSRQVGATYTISASDTWEYKTVTFPADTSGTLGNGNGLAAEINFVLQAGSNYTSGTLDTSWATETAANRAAGHNSNHFSSTSNTFHLTGVQLELGNAASPFEHRSFGEEFVLCQRYFQSLRGQDRYPGDVGEATVVFGSANLLQSPMRSQPSLSVSGALSFDEYYVSGRTQSSSSISRNSGNNQCVIPVFGNFGSMTRGNPGAIYNANIDIDAEL